MSRKTSSRSANTVVSASKTSTQSKTKSRAALTAIEKPKPFPAPGKSPAAVAAVPAAAVTAPPAAKAPVQPAQPKPAGPAPASPAPAVSKPRAPEGSEVTNQLLNRAERDIASAIDSLNTQMNVALTALAELASAHGERGKAVVRTAPLDRATATFQRLVSEVVDDHLTEMLPPLIALRNEMKQWSSGGENGSPEAEFHARGAEMLDNVLASAGAICFDARAGQTFDPLIHLAVGETHREDLPEGAVSECIQVGFRTTRGKVLAAARVRINRR